MKRLALIPLGLVVGFWLISAASVRASQEHFWRLRSPNHEQTFAYGSEQSRVWKQWGRDCHLALLLNYTNDPFVDRSNPRQYDNFRFDFPQVTLGQDGRIFYYRTPEGRMISVAKKVPTFSVSMKFVSCPMPTSSSTSLTATSP